MRRWLESLVVLLALVWARSAWAQDSVCSPVEIKAPATIDLPSGFKDAAKLKVAALKLGVIAEFITGFDFDVSQGKWVLDQAAFDRLKGLGSRNDRSNLQLVGLKDGQTAGMERFILPGEDRQKICAEGTAVGAVAVDGSKALQDWRECQAQFRALDQAIRARLDNGKYTVIVFMPSGKVCGQSRPFGVAGDLIYTAVFNDGSITPSGTKVEFTKCEALSPTPKNPELEVLAPALQAAGLAPKLFEFPARQCFGNSADMRLKNKILEGSAVTDVDFPYSLTLYERYRYTLQVGAVETDQRSESFGLRKDGNDMRIFSKGPEGRGPEYLATVVLYALPRYLRALRGRVGGDNAEQEITRVYYGRDVIHDQGLADRIGFVIGAGLKNPSDRFGVGLSFELGYGMNLIGIYERSKLKALAGVNEGDIFTGTVEQIPTREVWEEDWVFGLSLDLRYITGLFKRAS